MGEKRGVGMQIIGNLCLQGHEDLRQDERVMQLFGLVNTMLSHDRTTAERDLSIARYAVIPLSPNSGALLLPTPCGTLCKSYRCNCH